MVPMSDGEAGRLAQAVETLASEVARIREWQEKRDEEMRVVCTRVQTVEIDTASLRRHHDNLMKWFWSVAVGCVVSIIRTFFPGIGGHS